MKGKGELLDVIKRIAAGEYSGEIMELTRPEYPEETRELAEAVGMMMVQIEAREFHLEQLYERLKENTIKVVVSMANALSARDVYTKGHGVRVARYAARLAKRLGLPEEEVEPIRIGGVLHDVGKIGFSDKLFANSDTKPDRDMLAEIRHHPSWGVEILKGLDFLGTALDYVHAHHERMDGGGYPRGVPAGDLPVGARIVAVADCFDAMTTDRSYQKGRSLDTACDILRSLAGDHLDPELVDVFIEEVRENGMEE